VGTKEQRFAARNSGDILGIFFAFGSAETAAFMPDFLAYGGTRQQCH
jgi:hypothetical protein